MRTENLTELDHYIDTYVGTKSTRHISEDLFVCPPIADAIAGERNMRTSLHVVYDGVEAAAPRDIQLDELSSRYWDLARHVTDAHGANPNYSLDDYFHTRQGRNYDDLRAVALEGLSADSLTAALFDSIETYRDGLDLDTVSSTRLLFNLFDKNLPAIKSRTQELSVGNVIQAEASTMAVREFAEDTVSGHITYLKQMVTGGVDITASIEKGSLYPKTPAGLQNDVPLVLWREDAEGIMAAYHTREYPFDGTELALGEELTGLPAMRKSLLAFQLGLVEDAAEYLTAHPERAQSSLAPFSEVFVPLEGIDQLAPNPHLIKVIANNVMPAIARILIESNQGVENLTPDQIEAGVGLAKRLKVFQTKIGQFNNFDPGKGTVELYSMFTRTCPGNHFISSELIKRLPGLYDFYDRNTA